MAMSIYTRPVLSIVFLALCVTTANGQGGRLDGNHPKKRCYEMDLTVFYRIPGGLTLSNGEVTQKITGTFSMLRSLLVFLPECKDVSISIVDVSQTPPGQSNVVITSRMVFKAKSGVPHDKVDSRLSGCIRKSMTYKNVLDHNLPSLLVGGVRYPAFNISTISNKRSCCGGGMPPPCCAVGSVNVSLSRCACIPGYYSFRQDCLRCSPDSYQANRGQTSCSRCPRGTGTFNKTGMTSSLNCSDTNPLQIEDLGIEHIPKNVKPGSVVAEVNVSANFAVLVRPLLFSITSVTSKPSQNSQGRTPRSIASCHSAGNKPPDNFFCINRDTGEIGVTDDFTWREGDEFELTVHVTDSDPHGRTRASGEILLFSKDVCGNVKALYSEVQQSCPRDGLIKFPGTGPLSTTSVSIDINSVSAIIKARIKLSLVTRPATDSTYLLKLEGKNVKHEVLFRVDTIRTYNVVFVQPLNVAPGVNELKVELSVADQPYLINQPDAITLYGVPKPPQCPGARCLDALFLWQAALGKLTSHEASPSCSRDAQHMKLRYGGCLAAPNITLDPVPKKVKLGTEVEFSCNATAPLAMNVTWYKDAAPLDGATERRLRMTADKYDKQGYYHCEFRTAYSVAASKPALLVLSDVVTTVVKFKIVNKKYREIASLKKDFGAIFVTNLQNHLSGSETRWTFAVTFKGFSNWDDKVGVEAVINSPNVKPDMEKYYDSLKASLEEGARKGFSTGSKFSKKSILILNTENCFAEKTGKKTIKGVFVWPLTAIGQNAPDVSCVNGPPDARATRRCGGNFITGGIWSDPDVSRCSHRSKRTQELDRLAKTVVVPSNAKAVSREVRNLTSVPPGSLNEADASLTADLLEKIVAVDSALEETSGDVVDIVDKMMQIDEDALLESQKTSHASTKFINAMDKIAENLPISPNQTSRLIVSPNVAVQANRVRPQSFSGLLYGTSKPANGQGMTADNILTGEPTSRDDVEVSVSLPSNLFEGVAIGNSDTASVGFVIYQNSKFFQPAKDEDEEKTSSFVNSRVISASVQGVKVENLSKPLELVFRPLDTEARGTAAGAFWDLLAAGGLGNFSTRGCRTVSPPNSDLIEVEADHMTNFAVLFSASGPGQRELDQQHRLALSIISYVGCAISSLGVALTLVTYTLFRNLRQTNQQTILICLCITLAALLITFVAGAGRTEPVIGCRVAAVLLHYLALSTVAWMGVEGYNMYQCFIQVMGTYQSKFMLKASLVAWGVPAIIVVPTIAAATGYYGNDEACVLYGVPFYAAMFAPVVLIVLANCVIFFKVVHSLSTSGALFSVEKKSTTYQRCRTSISILVLLGLTWVFGALAIARARLAFEYLFCIFNSLQGVFIFFFHCIRHQEVRNRWKWFFMGKGVDYDASKSDSYPRSRAIGESTTGSPRNVKPKRFDVLSSKKNRRETISSTDVERKNGPVQTAEQRV